jgi:hypothetical protein
MEQAKREGEAMTKLTIIFDEGEQMFVDIVTEAHAGTVREWNWCSAISEALKKFVASNIRNAKISERRAVK